MNAPFLLGLILVASLSVSLVTDLRSRRIPNAITLPAFALALLVRALLGGWSGPDGLASGLLGAAVGFAPFFLIAWRGGMGMGDVKLVAVVGACLGGDRIVAALLCICVVGGLQGVLALLWTGSLGQTLHRSVHRIARALRLSRGPAPRARRVTVPYGVAIAFGTAWALAGSSWPGP